MQQIASTLRKINRWWKTGKVEDVFLYKTVRSEFDYIVNKLDERRILSVVGPRRVGKSTLLFQTVNYLLEKGVKPKHILFFSGDEPGLFAGKTNLGEVIEAYETDILQNNLHSLNDKIYMFIDEIHFIREWQLWIKSYYDRKLNIKFIISGSSSTHLFQGSKESLMGRIENVKVLPLNHKQFMKFASVYGNESDAEEFLDKLPRYSFFEDPKEYTREILKGKFDFDEYKIQITRILKEFLLVGGYPEYFEETNILLWQKKLAEDIILRGLYRDIVSIYSVKNPEILEKLMYFVADNNGQPHAYTTLADTLGVDFSTISNYTNYLTSAFLVSVLENYSTNVGKVIRKNKKLYVTDNGIRNALLRHNEFDDADGGQLVENSSVQLVRSYCEENLFNMHYWRENIREVDIVIDKKTDTLPIEVKYRNGITGKDLKGIKAFSETFGSKCSVVITKDLLKAEDNIIFMPLWLI